MSLSKLVTVAMVLSLAQASAQELVTETEQVEPQAVSASAELAPVVVQQPPTVVEDSPLDESNAARLRRKRQDAEVGTEQKIVEKLEESRLQDETDRADRLFGDRFNKVEAAPAAPAPVVTVVPTTVSDESNSKNEDLEDVKGLVNEVKADLEAEREARKKKERGDSFFISGLVGAGEYPDGYDVDNNGALGFSVGAEYASGVAVDFTFVYSKYFLGTDSWNYRFGSVYEELEQQNYGISVRMNLLQARIRPYVGGTVNYVLRTYSDEGYYWDYYGEDYEDGESESIDVGAIVGADFLVTDRFSIGADVRYMTNLSNDVRRGFAGYSAGGGSEMVEEQDYYIMSVIGKAHF